MCEHNTIMFLCPGTDSRVPSVDSSSIRIWFRKCISKSRQIEWWNQEHRFIIQVLHGSPKTFRLRITKNNLLNSRFTENKNQLVTHYGNTPVRPSENWKHTFTAYIVLTVPTKKKTHSYQPLAWHSQSPLAVRCSSKIIVTWPHRIVCENNRQRNITITPSLEVFKSCVLTAKILSKFGIKNSSSLTF